MGTTLKRLAASDHPASRGAAALIQAGYPDGTSLQALTPGSVTRTLVELFARELAKVYEQLGEVYESAFLDTGTGESLQVLVDGLFPRRACWWRLFRSRG
jgi:N-methylhydantoinase B/oxoprolinase/acetone carboxylase alpha subunit